MRAASRGDGRPVGPLVHRLRNSLTDSAALAAARCVATPPNIPDIRRRRALPAPTIIHDLMDAISGTVHPSGRGEPGGRGVKGRRASRTNRRAELPDSGSARLGRRRRRSGRRLPTSRTARRTGSPRGRRRWADRRSGSNHGTRVGRRRESCFNKPLASSSADSDATIVGPVGRSH